MAKKSKPRKTPYWWAAIARARVRGTFTVSEMAKANNWVTCACGWQDKAMPDSEYRGPEDCQLRKLGFSFGIAVDRSNFDRAEMLLTKIEKRAAEILRL